MEFNHILLIVMGIIFIIAFIVLLSSDFKFRVIQKDIDESIEKNESKIDEIKNRR